MIIRVYDYKTSPSLRIHIHPGNRSIPVAAAAIPSGGGSGGRHMPAFPTWSLLPTRGVAPQEAGARTLEGLGPRRAA